MDPSLLLARLHRVLIDDWYDDDDDDDDNDDNVIDVIEQLNITAHFSVDPQLYILCSTIYDLIIFVPFLHPYL